VSPEAVHLVGLSVLRELHLEISAGSVPCASSVKSIRRVAAVQGLHMHVSRLWALYRHILTRPCIVALQTSHRESEVKIRIQLGVCDETDGQIIFGASCNETKKTASVKPVSAAKTLHQNEYNANQPMQET